MKTTLEELYLQYEQSIENQKKIIEENKIKLKQAQLKRNFNEVSRLTRLGRLLYEEKLEMESAAISLRGYFNKNIAS